ncbi:hypothetical protein BS50DRAFT_572158, partial [Corynespora cassiicola Philippines]
AKILKDVAHQVKSLERQLRAQNSEVSQLSAKHEDVRRKLSMSTNIISEHELKKLFHERNTLNNHVSKLQSRLFALKSSLEQKDRFAAEAQEGKSHLEKENEMLRKELEDIRKAQNSQKAVPLLLLL